MKLTFTLLALALVLMLGWVYTQQITPGAPAAPKKTAVMAGKVAAGKTTRPLGIDRLTES